MKSQPFSMIVAYDQARQIGLDNTLPWKLPTDMAHFRQITAGKAVLMGRKTAESIGRALPKRTNLVMTRGTTAPYAGQQTVRSLEGARTLAGSDEVICIGGGEIYSLLMPFADRLYVTEVQTTLDKSDTVFPKIHPYHFQLISAGEWVQNDGDEYPVRMLEYGRY